MTKKGNSLLGSIEIILAMAMAGSSITAGKMLTHHYTPFFIGAVSSLIAVILLLPLVLKKREEIKALKWKDMSNMILQALFGIILFRVFTLWGLQRSSSFLCAVITSMTPLCFCLASFVFLGEKPGVLKLLAAFAAVLGLILIHWDPLIPGHLHVGAGSLFILLAVFCETMMTIFRKKSVHPCSSIINSFFLFLIAFLFFLMAAMLTDSFKDISNIPVKDWGILFFYGAVGSALAYLLWGDGAIRISAIRTGLLTLFMPLTAMVLSIGILGEIPRPVQITGAFIALAGLVPGNWPVSRPEKIAEQLDQGKANHR